MLHKKILKSIKDKKIKIISFDVFSTLVYRNSNREEDVFTQMGNDKTVKKYFVDSANFRNYRKNANLKSNSKISSDESTLEQIYQELNISKKDRKKLIHKELTAEKNNIFINTEMVRLIKKAKKHNKKILFTSDMYIDSRQMKYILGKKLFELSDAVYISCETGFSKYSSRQFSFLLKQEKIDPEEMIHIGDHYLSDFVIPRQMGIKCFYYNTDHDYADSFQHDTVYVKYQGLSYNNYKRLALVKNPFKTDKERFFYNFGCFVVGLPMYIFLKSIIDIARSRNIKQVNFARREGRAFIKYFNNMPSTIKTNLLSVSRFSTFLASMDENEPVRLNLYNYKNYTVGNILRQYKIPIGGMISSLLRKQVSSLTLNEKKSVTDYIEQNKALIQSNIKEEKKLFNKYLKDAGVQDQSMLVDYGGWGTILNQVESASGLEFLKYLFFISRDGYSRYSSRPTQSFLAYSPGTEKALSKIHLSDIYEILFNGNLATTLGYIDKGDKTEVVYDKQRFINDPSIFNAFDLGVLNFLKIANQYQLDVSRVHPDDILKILARPIEFPTEQEARYLGKLNFESSHTSKHRSCLVDNKKIKKLKKMGLNSVYSRYLFNYRFYEQTFPWVEGVITSINKNFLNERFGLIPSNAEKIKTIVAYLLKNNINEVCIYGTGEIFYLLFSSLNSYDIKIKHLIDSNKELHGSSLMGLKILSPGKGLKKQDNVIIASFSFYDEIASTIKIIAPGINIIGVSG